jgi:hypothetical protein
MSTSKAFELLHMDLFGPTTYTSIGGKLVQNQTFQTLTEFIEKIIKIYDIKLVQLDVS